MKRDSTEGFKVRKVEEMTVKERCLTWHIVTSRAISKKKSLTKWNHKAL
jgi:hypothetical protein